jgi:hypothetical protein
VKVRELIEVELAKQGVLGYKLEWYRDPDWGYVYIVEVGLNARRALDSGVEGAIDLFYFLVSHEYMADPFHLTYYIKEVLNDSDVVHVGHWISDYSLMIRTLRVKNKIPATTRILCHALIRLLSIKSEVRYFEQGYCCLQ